MGGLYVWIGDGCVRNQTFSFFLSTGAGGYAVGQVAEVRRFCFLAHLVLVLDPPMQTTRR